MLEPTDEFMIQGLLFGRPQRIGNVFCEICRENSESDRSDKSGGARKKYDSKYAKASDGGALRYDSTICCTCSRQSVRSALFPYSRPHPKHSLHARRWGTLTEEAMDKNNISQ